MEWNLFFDIYSSNFRTLTEKDGLPEWKRFADQIKSPDVLRDAIKPLAESYALGKNSGLGSKAPTLYQIRKAFTDHCNKIRSEQDFAANIQTCTSCRGSGYFFVFAPLADDHDRRAWPPDPAAMDFKQVRGIEAVKCPTCSGKYSAYMRARILAYGVPDWNRDALYTKLKNPPDWAKKKIIL